MLPFFGGFFLFFVFCVFFFFSISLSRPISVQRADLSRYSEFILTVIIGNAFISLFNPYPWRCFLQILQERARMWPLKVSCNGVSVQPVAHLLVRITTWSAFILMGTDVETLGEVIGCSQQKNKQCLLNVVRGFAICKSSQFTCQNAVYECQQQFIPPYSWARKGDVDWCECSANM